MEPVFGHRHVDHLGVAAVKRIAECVAGDADDLVGRPVGKNFAPVVALPAGAQMEATANGVLAGPELGPLIR